MAIYSTLQDQIDAIKDSEIAYRTLHKNAVVRDENSGINIRVPFKSLIHDYKDYLESIVLTVPMDEESEKMYRFNPKRFSYDTYNTTELWAEIMDLNNCTSICEFKPTSFIKVYNPDKLKTLINEILIIGEDS